MSLIKELDAFRKVHGGNFTRAGITFADNMVTYALNKKPWRGPLYVDWEISYKCNARCTYCDSWKVGMESKIPDVSTEVAKKTIREMGVRGVWLLIFTGGEPFVRPDFLELVKEAKNAGMNVSINTNGFFLKRDAQKIVDLGVDSITVSVESHESEVHDTVRRTKNLFKMLSEGIEELKRIRKQKPAIKVRMEIGRDSYKRAKAFIEYWQDKADGIVLQPIHEGIGKDIFVMSEEMKFKTDDKTEFDKEFSLLAKQYSWMNNQYYQEFSTFFFDKEELYKKFKCYSGFFYLQIDPYGNVYNCTEYIANVGNILHQSFDEIWYGQKMNNVRKMIKEGTNTCVCHYYCTGPVNCSMSKVFGNTRKDGAMLRTHSGKKIGLSVDAPMSNHEQR